MNVEPKAEKEDDGNNNNNKNKLRRLSFNRWSITKVHIRRQHMHCLGAHEYVTSLHFGHQRIIVCFNAVIIYEIFIFYMEFLFFF